MDVTFTIEDMIFLKEPFSFTWAYEKTDPPPLRNQVNYVCDRSIGWAEIEITGAAQYNPPQ